MNQEQLQFIASISPKAQELQQKYRIPASIIIAQAALESGWGKHAVGNNYFGIKAGSSWQGNTVSFLTHEEDKNGNHHAEVDKFRAYACAADSMEDHAKLLATKARYAGVIGANGYQAADALQCAGYATESNYSSQLKSIIRSNGLTRFDDASYRGYADNDVSFEETNQRLHLKRQADPLSWDDLKLGIVKFMIGMLFSFMDKANATPAHDTRQTVQPPLPTPNHVQTAQAHTKTPARA